MSTLAVDRRPADGAVGGVPTSSPAWVTVLLVAVVSLPFVVGAVQLFGEPEFYLYGDQARIAVEVERSLQLLQYTGPYSRYGWDHPGPLAYYFLAPGTWLLSGGAGIYLGALLTNWLFVGSTVLLAARSAPPRQVGALTGVLLLFLLAFGSESLQDPWNPAIVVLPLLCAAFAMALRPTLASTCLLVVGCSLALQAHFGTVSVVAAVLLVAAAAHACTRPARPPLVPVLVVIGVTLLCWAPPLVDLAREGRDANLVRVLQFNLTADGPRNTLRRAAEAVLGASRFENTPARVPPVAPQGPVWLWCLAWLLAGSAGCALAVRRRLRLPAVLCALGAVGLVVVTVAISRIVGGIEVYLLWWVPIPVVALLAGWLVLLVGEGGLVRRAPTSAVLAGVVLLGVTTALLDEPDVHTSNAEVGAAAALVLAELDRPGPIGIELPDPEVAPFADGVAATLVGEGRAVVVAGSALDTRGSGAPRAATIRIVKTGSGNDDGGVLLTRTEDEAAGATVYLVP